MSHITVFLFDFLFFLLKSLCWEISFLGKGTDRPYGQHRDLVINRSSLYLRKNKSEKVMREELVEVLTTQQMEPIFYNQLGVSSSSVDTCHQLRSHTTLSSFSSSSSSFTFFTSFSSLISTTQTLKGDTIMNIDIPN